MTLEKQTIAYFQQKLQSFWVWAEGNEIIEWGNSKTLCYKQELTNVLKVLQPTGFPTLDVILLLLEIIKGNFQEDTKEWLFMKEKAMQFHNNETHKISFKSLLEFTKIIKNLKDKYKIDNNRMFLMALLCQEAPIEVMPNVTESVLVSFTSGNLEDAISKNTDTTNQQQNPFKSIEQAFYRLLAHYPTPQSIALQLQTGISKELAPFEMPFETPPKASELPLLEQLAQDSQTYNLYDLTKRLIAALHIPMHSQGSSDQSFGGISDITNRGNFDRLLLSELAQDDILLMARLANNEALYLRREELPSQITRKRVILIDTNLKMWGLPRIFAVATALACSLQNKLKAQIEVSALLESRVVRLDFTSKEGVAAALDILNPALYNGKALKQAMNQTASKNEMIEYFFITEESILQSPAFQETFVQLKTSLNYLIGINRDGKLQFFECGQQQRKLLNTFYFDLKEAVQNQKFVTRNTTTQSSEFPKGLVANNLMYLPTSKVFQKDSIRFDLTNKRFFAIMHDRQIIYIPDPKKGGIELHKGIKNGKCKVGQISENLLYICVQVYEPIGIKLYKIDLENLKATEEVQAVFNWHSIGQIIFKNGLFYAVCQTEKYQSQVVSIDPNTGETLLTGESWVYSGTELAVAPKRSSYKQNGYLSRIHYIGLNEKRQLVVNNHVLDLVFHELRWLNHIDKEKKFQPVSREEISKKNFESNSSNRILKFLWADGSEVWSDSKGFLHLKSSNKNIPEIMIAMALETPTAALAIDTNEACGNDYFLDEKRFKIIPESVFYRNYLAPFLAQLT